MIVIALALALSAPPPPAVPPPAAPVVASTVTVHDAWVRLPPPAAPTAAAFFTMKNVGEADRKLVAVSVDVEGVRCELHTHLHENGVMKMRKVEAIEVKKQQTQKLQPMGLHVMLLDLKKPLVDKQVLTFLLTFDDGSKVTLLAPVGKELPAKAPVPLPG